MKYRRLNFEKVILELTKELINVPIDKIDDAIDNSLDVIGALCEAESILLLQCDWPTKEAYVRNQWGQNKNEFHVKRQPLFSLFSQDVDTILKGFDFSIPHPKINGDHSINDKTLNCYPLKSADRILGVFAIILSNDLKRNRKKISQVIHIYCEMLTSIFTRIEREKELLQKTSVLQLLLDSTTDGIGMMDESGAILSINKEFGRRFNRKPEDMIGKKMKDIFPKDQYGDLSSDRSDQVRRVYETKMPVIFEDTRDGLWFHNRTYPVFKDDRVAAIAFFSTDITAHIELEKKEKELLALKIKSEELMKKEAEYLEILDSSTQGSYVVDFIEGTTRYSENWKKRLGLEGSSPQEILNRFHERMLPEEAEESIKIRYEMEEDKKTRLIRVIKVKDRDDKVMWVLVHGKMIYDDAGKLIKTYGAFTDITELKELELELMRQRNELAEKNRLITEFFTNISHEFRTPLSILLMKLEGLDSSEAFNEREELRATIAAMENNIFRLTKLVSNLLDVTKIESGFEAVNLSPADIVSVAKELTASVSEYAGKAGLSLTFSAQSDAFVATIDKEKIERILLNLISNAIKNTASGGNISVDVVVKKNQYILSVTDDGIGIPRDMHEIIFDRFKQANPSLTRYSEGCGIGLSLTKGLVELMGGQISVKSKEGKGSTFSVELPLYKADQSKKSIVSDGLPLSKKIQIELSDLSLGSRKM